jgi:hypothetical protein
VGGFSLSPYLYRNLQQLFGSSCVIHRPDKGFVLTILCLFSCELLKLLGRIMAVALGAVSWGSGACRPRTRVVRCHYGFQGPILTDESLKSQAALAAAIPRLTSQANRLYWVIKKVISPRTRRLDGGSTRVRWKLLFLMLCLIYRENGTMQITFMNRVVFCCIVKERLLSRRSSFVVRRETLNLPASTIQVCYFMSSILSYILTIFFRNCVDWLPDLRHLPYPFTQLPPL